MTTDIGTWDFNCIVLDETTGRQSEIFYVSILSNARVQELYNAILSKSGVKEADILMDSTLWRLIKEDIPVEDAPFDVKKAIDRLPFPDVKKESQSKNDHVEGLRLALFLSKYWATQPDPECLHVILFSRPVRKRKYDDEGIKQLKTKCAKLSPSVLGRAENFKDIVGPEQPIGLNRPFEYNTIPLPLLHPAFGTFKDRCRELPSNQALTFLNELSECACAWYPSETQRRDAIRDVFQRILNIELHPEKVSGAECITDGNISVFIMPGLIRECKNEAETALNQLILYFVQMLLNAYQKYPNVESCFPCILMIDMGSQMQFYGAVWDGKRVRAEPLTRGLDLATSFMERRDRDELASVFDALLAAISQITEHYQSIQNTNSWDNDRRQFPFLSSYVENDQEVSFRYTERLFKDKLIFGAVIDDAMVDDSNSASPPQQLIVKFAHRYSLAAHEFLAERGLAPRVRASIPISTDWTAIVMDKLNYPTLAQQREHMNQVQYEKVQSKAESIVQTLHEGDFVHGDVRDANLLIDPQSLNLDLDKVVVYLIDFDWAGGTNEAKYPADVNTKTVKRPQGIQGGGSILKQHDYFMVSCLL